MAVNLGGPLFFFLWPLMKRFLFLAMLLLCCCADASAANGPGVLVGGTPAPDTSQKQGGGLACFVVAQDGDEKTNPSCDEVCGAQDAVCVSLENFAPFSCTMHVTKDIKCRCCRAVR